MWTDGRYFLQASRQLDENWTLMKASLPETPTRDMWIVKELSSQGGGSIGVDPSLITPDLFNKWKETFDKSRKPISWKLISENLVDTIWTDRPARPREPVHVLDVSFSGMSTGDKLLKVREYLSSNKYEGIVVSALDEIAWILNWRGSDISFNPVFFSYLWIDSESTVIYIDERKISSDSCQEALLPEMVVKKYEQVLDDLRAWGLSKEPERGTKLFLSHGSSLALANAAGTVSV